MSVTVERERPDAPDATALILELEEHLAALYPAESRHVFSVERLVADDVHLFVLRADGGVRLETGIHQRVAIGLYESMGFRSSAPFGPYRDDPLSRCFELPLPDG